MNFCNLEEGRPGEPIPQSATENKSKGLLTPCVSPAAADLALLKGVLRALQCSERETHSKRPQNFPANIVSQTQWKPNRWWTRFLGGSPALLPRGHQLAPPHDVDQETPRVTAALILPASPGLSHPASLP